MLSLNSGQRQAMASVADSSISDGLDGTLLGWKSGATKTEPDAVAVLVTVGLPSAAIGWTSTLRPLGYNVHIVGVFCHGTPYVQFSNPRGVQQPPCEVGDILIVVDAGATSAPPDRRAFLVQAKLAVHPQKG